MEILSQTLLEIIFEFIIFMIFVLLGIFVVNKIKNSDNRYFNPQEFLPEDEIHTLKQVLYLILMSSCFIVIIYQLAFINQDSIYLCIFDCILSLVIAVLLDKSSSKNKILLVLLVPFGSLNYLIFDQTLLGLFDFIHIPVFIYFIKYFYDKFKEYTESNSLGLAIILLFTIILISFFITQLTEGTNPLDAAVMVSNAFTSNGYAVLGNTIPGKINSVFLVWGGYIISGVGTATLTAAILIRQFNKRFDQLQKIIDEKGDNNG